MALARTEAGFVVRDLSYFSLSYPFGETMLFLSLGISMHDESAGAIEVLWGHMISSAMPTTPAFS